MKPTLGILGAGKLGIVLAQLFIKAGYTVYIAGSTDVDKIALTIKVLAPGAIAGTREQVAEKADIAILALPLGKYTSIPVQELHGKLVIDAMNYWWEVDGDRPDLHEGTLSTSEIVQSYLSDSRVVKAFSHIGYHDLHDETQPDPTKPQKGMAIAGDAKKDLEQTSELVRDAGFEPVVIGKLSEGVKLEPGHTVFGAHVDATTLTQMLQ